MAMLSLVLLDVDGQQDDACPNYCVKDVLMRFGLAGSGVRRSESKESVATGARALTMLCHWGTCKTKEDDAVPAPYVRVRLKVSPSHCKGNSVLSVLKGMQDSVASLQESGIQPFHYCVNCLRACKSLENYVRGKCAYTSNGDD